MVAEELRDRPVWPADAVSRHPVEGLIPYAANARTHSAEQVGEIARSIEAFGFTVPVLVDEAGGIIAGHGRVMAAKKLGLADVPVMVASGWTDEQKRAYVLADNKIALNAGWDDDLLKAELAALSAANFDLGLTGFDAADLAGLGMGPVRGDPEETPEPPKIPVSQLGDIWLLGNHKVLCGDSTSADAVAQLLGDAKPHLMVTDPPYGVNYDPDWRNRADRANGKPYGARAVGLVQNDDRADWTEAYRLFPGGVAYVWHPPGARQVEFFNSLVAADFEIRMQVIWAKQQFPIGRGNYHVQHEPCWYAVRKGSTAHWQGSRKESTLWEIDKPVKSETGHSTQKPIECMRRPILNNSETGDAIYDPFLGSGTTLIAAEMEVRKCFGLELDPVYVDVIVQRWESFTGRIARLEADGRAFSEVAAERLPNDALQAAQ